MDHTESSVETLIQGGGTTVDGMSQKGPGVADYPIVVSVTVHGTTIRAMGFVRWAGPTPTPEGLVQTSEYSLPNGWIMNVSTIGSGVLPTVANPTTTSLLALERTAC